MVDSSNPNFDIAKQQVIHGLEKLTKFSSDMDKKYPTCGFAPFVQRLRQLEGVIQTYGTCLSSNQIHEIESFAQHLSSNRVLSTAILPIVDFSPNCNNFGGFVRVLLIRAER